MLGWVVGSSVRHRRVLVVIALVVMVAGVWQLRQAKVDVLPEFAPPTVEVQTEALGLSAQEMEQLITVPLERDFLNGIPFLSTISSKSLPGLSSVVLVFEPGTNLFTARQLVQERLSLTTELAHVSKPPQMLQAVSSASRVEMIGLRSGTVPPIQMSVLAQFTIRPRLLGVPGVANISIFGQRDLQLQVQVDPAKLRARGVSLDQVVTTAGNALFVSPLSFLEASTPGAGGFFDTPNQRLGVQHILPIRSPEDLSRVAVAESATPLSLGDVATVVQDHQPLIGDAAPEGGPGLLLVVQKLPGANTTEVTKAVNQALDSLRPGLAGVDIDTNLYRPAGFVHTAVGNVRRSAVVAAVLVLLGLALLFADWRSVLVGAATIPLALTAAAYVLYLRGATFDSMAVAGLVLGVGLVVHDAVAVTDALARRAGADPVPDGSTDPAGDTLAGVGRPVAVATIVVGIGLVPVLFLAGLPSKPFLPPIALSYALAVGASLLVALTVAPALGGLVLPARGRGDAGGAGRTEPRVVRLIRRGYGAVLWPAVRRPAVALAAVGLLVAIPGVLAATQLRPSLSPSFDETDLLVRWEGPPGTALGEMNRIVGLAGAELRTVKGVRDVGSHVGRAIGSDQVVGSNSGETWISIDAKADHDSTVAAITKVVDGYPGMGHQLLSYFNDQVKAAQGATKAPVVVRLYGQDLDLLHAKGTEIKGVLDRVKGVRGAQVEAEVKQPIIQVSVDLAAADRLGIKPGDVRRGATTLVSGLPVGSLYEDQKVFQVVVVGAPDLSRSLTAVQDLAIDLPQGGQVRLGDVATVDIGPGLSVIEHNNVSRSLDVTAQVDGRDAGSVLADVRQRLRAVSFPAEYYAQVLGGSGARRSADVRLAVAGVLAALMIYLVLQAAFESWRSAAMALVAVPPALAGGAIAAWATGGTLSLGSVVGFFAVGALALRTGVLVLSRFRHLGRRHPGTASLSIVVQGSLQSLPPVLGAAVLTALAMLPFALGHGPGTEIVRPMAVVVLGGLIAGTVVTLLGLPAAYVVAGRASPPTDGADENLPPPPLNGAHAGPVEILVLEPALAGSSVGLEPEGPGPAVVVAVAVDVDRAVPGPAGALPTAAGPPAHGALTDGPPANGASIHGTSTNGTSTNGTSTNGAPINGAPADGASAHKDPADGASTGGAGAGAPAGSRRRLRLWPRQPPPTAAPHPPGPAPAASEPPAADPPEKEAPDGGS